MWASLGVLGLSGEVILSSTVCPIGDDETSRIRAEIGAKTLSPSPRVAVTIAAGSNGELDVEVTARLGDFEEHRGFTAPSCAAALEAASLVASVTLNALETDLRKPEVEVEDTPPTVRVPDPPAARAEAPEQRPASARPPTTAGHERRPASGPSWPRPAVRSAGELSVVVGIAGGIVPRPSLGVEVGPGVQLDAWALRFSAVYVLPQAAPIASGGSVEVQLWAGKLTLEYALRWRVVEVPVWAALIVGGQRGQGIDVTGANAATEAYGATQLGTGVRLRLHPIVRLGIDAAAHAAFTRPVFALGSPASPGYTEAFRAPVWGYWSGISLSLRFR